MRDIVVVVISQNGSRQNDIVETALVEKAVGKMT